MKTKVREAMNPQTTTNGTDSILAKSGVINRERKATTAVDIANEIRLTVQNREN